MTEDEAREYATELLTVMQRFGPTGQDLADRMMKQAKDAHNMELIIAMTFMRCFLEDATGQPDHIAAAIDLTYTVIRDRIDDLNAQKVAH